MPESDQRSYEQKTQFKEIFSWQREMMLAEETLQDISRHLRREQLGDAADWADAADDAYGEEAMDSERQRHRFLQRLQHMQPEQHRRVYARVRAHHKELLSSIFELKEILDEDFSVEPPDFT